MRQQLVCGQIARLASVEDGFGDVWGEIAPYSSTAVLPM
jgi:hypothetical protein